ncbi:Hypothetical Protein FCC1311_035572 [Hondaea fermentalgiana]|uniref:Uncharacterized protein n=1 Tax=Hondaea fermentalgiana TaxID=2315210 RepID=A0A2R5G9U1_9STRA|nr:Hypothetical Protein FCC1311_035572 [Hondaea fermentalgiana]|eukprot:GBG27335.1 Hypothetical Protein FCC1311_035572 [Hondaea fermentalgiana]
MTDYGDEDVLGAEKDKDDDDDDDDDDDHNEEEGMIADNLPAFDLYKRQQWSMNGTLEMDCHEGKVPEYQERFDLHNKVFREEKDCEVDKLGFLDDEENADVLNRQPPLCGLLRVSESTSAHYDEVFTNSIKCKEFLREDHSEEECKDDFPGDTMESMIDYGTSEML